MQCAFQRCASYAGYTCGFNGDFDSRILEDRNPPICVVDFFNITIGKNNGDDWYLVRSQSKMV